MRRADPTQQLLLVFAEELDEHLRALNRDLLLLEQGVEEDRAALVHSLFRSAHTLKGAARAVSLLEIERACHVLEEHLGVLRATTRPLEPAEVQRLFDMVDVVGRASKKQVPSVQVPAVEPVRESAAPEEPHRRSPREAEFTRIPSIKLDEVFLRGDEVSVARHRLAVHAQAMDALRDDLVGLRQEWEKAERWVNAASAQLQSTNESPSTALIRKRPRSIDGLAERLLRLEGESGQLSRSFSADLRAFSQAASSLEDEIRDLRLIPFSEACQGIERAVRDLAATFGKEIEVSLEGQNVSLDRNIVNALRDPILHLVRNAIDHGIELPKDRIASGKPGRGKISIGAVARGTQVDVTVRDDGRGVDPEDIRAALRRAGTLVPTDDREVLRALLQPGFSTATEVSEVSGRGVGLDVVAMTSLTLKGGFDFHTEKGKGLTATLTLPVTLSRSRLLLVRAEDDVFGIPSSQVVHLRRVKAEEILRDGERDLIRAEGTRTIQLSSLSRVLDLTPSPRANGTALLVVIVTNSGREHAFAVDDVIEERDVVLKGLGARLGAMKGLLGCTILPSGRAALVLSTAELIRRAEENRGRPSVGQEPRASAVKRKCILVADDSLTTRSLEKAILEGAGYDVITASDGAEAFRLLQTNEVDLLVSDVEMPRMTGLALTEQIRNSQRLRTLPVVLVTGLANDVDKARGLEVGANAYIVKSAFDQVDLLATIARLL